MRWFICSAAADACYPPQSCDIELLCRGFQELGAECCMVSAGSRQPNKPVESLHTDTRNLESSAWWRALHLDGVVLFSDDSFQSHRVAKAIHDAGVFLVLPQDGNGVLSPLVGFDEWLEEQWLLSGAWHSPSRWTHYAWRVLYGLTLDLMIHGPIRAECLAYADMIGCQTPAAIARYQNLCTYYGGADLATRVRGVPYPVNPIFCYPEGWQKACKIVVVHDSDHALFKRDSFLFAVIAELLHRDRWVELALVGPITQEIEAWSHSLSAAQSARLHVHGPLDKDALAGLFASSQVGYCPCVYAPHSHASAEALCCGCSLVAADSPHLPAFRWFAAQNAGCLAEDTVDGHVSALIAELDAWSVGARDARQLSSTWGQTFYPNNVAWSIVQQAACSPRHHHPVPA